MYNSRKDMYIYIAIIATLHNTLYIKIQITVIFRLDTFYRFLSCTFVINWRSYLMFFRTPLFFTSPKDFNLVSNFAVSLVSCAIVYQECLLMTGATSLMHIGNKIYSAGSALIRLVFWKSQSFWIKDSFSQIFVCQKLHEH